MTFDPGLRGYLQTHVVLRTMAAIPAPKGLKYRCFEDFVLARGRAFADADVRSEQECYLLEIADEGRALFAAKECFQNAQWLLEHDHDGRLEYVEGYVSGLIPVLHAWCLLDGEVLVDPTFATDGKPRFDGPGPIDSGVIGRLPDGREYFGVVFDRARVIEEIPHMLTSYSFIDDPDRDFPALRGAYDPVESAP